MAKAGWMKVRGWLGGDWGAGLVEVQVMWLIKRRVVWVGEGVLAGCVGE